MSDSVRSAAAPPSWLDDDTLSAVRPQVRRLLESSPGFRELPVAEQQELARNMVRVASYMTNPDGLAKQELTPGQGILAKSQGSEDGLTRALAGEVDQAKGKASDKIGTFAGSDFKAGSVEQGADNFKKYIGSVDFPAFVGGLIQNVFQAIVNASIQQMNAYGELLKSVAQTVDQFAADNISLNNARDWLVDRFPGDLGIDASDSEGGGPRLTNINQEDDQAALARINAELQIAQPITDISDADQEARLTQAARLQMARSRQQLLSSMVILGINRIVVTDGAINAKVVFDFRASDEASRSAGASLYDSQSSMNRNRSAAGVHFGWGAAGSVNENVQRHMTTVSSSVSEDSESKQDMKAKLTGEVRVNFKSDYFPMEKLASPAMIAAIQGNSTPVDPNYVPGARGAGGGAAGGAQGSGNR
ncbi:MULTISPECIES: hypothetical protein [unclassified Lysobacter]|uniref:hypothetical protein n=1 Tax=unclassified Lysobacter TaxID=2635362 RepID=UPI0006FAEDD0|nr:MULTISPECIES: hypothetical protein [unclassified Lysobacter]KRA16484.1 hypothetical protein ASD69_16365 [Lysobacter sp. Root604]KRD32184.1 hypothetical protein ASE35_13610 [Lysobacter sp. Root916]KRD75861.1 hypothetical protein ASE43_13595 [Lysobacter sp. Root983]